jgi:S-adenosylmethionine/arginine decarboxylase-like enzyme
MNKTPLTNIAPEIFRKRLLIEGFFKIEITPDVLKDYFTHITSQLGLRTYDEPIIHTTSGQGKTVNEGYDGFVPLVDSGIYIAVWVNPKFLSTIIYTCGEFDADKAVESVRSFFQMGELQSAIF